MSNGGDDTEPVIAHPKKRGRGPTQLTRVVNKPGKEVKFDRLGRPIINEDTTSYLSILGTVVRANVPVCFKEWPDVPDFIKLKMWQQIMMEWNLPNDERLKKEVFSRMAVHYRRFRATLTKHYFQEGKTPFEDFSSITQADWDEFVKYRQSEEFQELSEKGKVNQSKQVLPFLGILWI